MDFRVFVRLVAHFDNIVMTEQCVRIEPDFRVEHQTAEGEALRNDEDYAYVAAWEHRGTGTAPTLHRESLEFVNVQLAQRSYS